MRNTDYIKAITGARPMMPRKSIIFVKFSFYSQKLRFLRVSRAPQSAPLVTKRTQFN